MEVKKKKEWRWEEARGGDADSSGGQTLRGWRKRGGGEFHTTHRGDSNEKLNCSVCISIPNWFGRRAAAISLTSHNE